MSISNLTGYLYYNQSSTGGTTKIYDVMSNRPFAFVMALKRKNATTLFSNNLIYARGGDEYGSGGSFVFLANDSLLKLIEFGNDYGNSGTVFVDPGVSMAGYSDTSGARGDGWVWTIIRCTSASSRTFGYEDTIYPVDNTVIGMPSYNDFYFHADEADLEMAWFSVYNGYGPTDSQFQAIRNGTINPSQADNFLDGFRFETNSQSINGILHLDEGGTYTYLADSNPYSATVPGGGGGTPTSPSRRVWVQGFGF